MRSRSEIMEDGASVSSASGSGGGHGSSSTSSSSGEDVLLRIHVPELKVEKCMQFHKEDLVWEVKQQALANLPKELREGFNYGLFYPPQNGRAGKFLDEERPLSDYPFSSPVGYLELKYKRRVYKMLHLDEKSLRPLHSRASLRRFLEYVKENNVEKVAKLCAKGLDPNFHCQETGETPLTIGARLKKGGKMIMALVNGGALLDYRTKEGLTPMHRAVQSDNFEAVKTLLDLGASPNYRDIRGLTPLYYSVTHATDPMLCEALLHDYSIIGASDNQGWQETHQACRNKLVQHLEHLLFYGADMNAQNASGNTPLHVCAVNNLEDCARVLLFRGCDKNALNYANQTPYQVAVIAGNMELAQIIQNHSSSSVVPYKEPPKYNPKRRISGVPLSRAHSDPRLEVCIVNKPPSPTPSNRSIPPFSSASSLSETSTGSGSTCTHPSEADSEECPSGMVSSGINPVTASTDDGMLEGCLKGKSGLFPPQCVQEIRLRNPKAVKENIIGRVQNRNGSMSSCSSDATTMSAPSTSQQSQQQQQQQQHQQQQQQQFQQPQQYHQNQIYGTTPRMKKSFPEPRFVTLHRGKKGFGFVLRGAKATSPLIERPYERGPALQYLDDVDPGGVADEAGLKKGDYLLKINGEDVSQASHEHVVNLIKKSGDVVHMSVISPPSISFLHSKAVYAAPSRGVLPPPAPPPRDPRTTLSVGRARAKSMVAGLHDFEALDNMHVTKEPVSMSRSAYYVSGFTSTSDDSSNELSSPNANGGVGFSSSLSNGMKIATVHPRVVSSRSMSSSQGAESNSFEAPIRFSPTGKPPKVYASVAEMKKAKALKARLAADSSRLHKEFHSTPDLQGEVLPVVLSQLSLEEKRKSLSQEEIFISAQNVANQRLSLDSSHPLSSFEKKKMMQRVYDHPKLRRSQSAVNPNQLKVTVGSHPPPSHPPPPVPLGQVIKVDLNKSKGDYASVGNANELNGTAQAPLQTSVEGSFTSEDPQSPGVKSSFRPSDSAKLYASPEDIKAFGYKATESGTLNRNKNGIAKTRSQSLPPSVKRQQEPYIPEKETSGDSGVYSATYSTFRGRTSEGQSVDEVINEKVTYARPKNNRSISESSVKVEPSKLHTRSCSISGKPNIPEPDYSSDEESAYSLQEDLKKRPVKKKKQNVMFAPNLVSSSSRDMSDSPHYAAPSKSNSNSVNTLGNGSNNFADLIAQKAAERKARQENGGGSAPASTTSSPIKKRNGQNGKSVCLSDAIKGSDLFNKQREKATEITTPITQTTTFSGNNNNNNNNNNNGNGMKLKPNGVLQDESKQNLKMKNSRSYPNEFSIEDGDSSSSGVSSDQEHVHQETSYVTVINTESDSIIEQKCERLTRSNSRDDSSEASESSDEASDRTWILTNERGDKSDSGKDSDSSSGSRRSGTLTKNAVSLVKLPPPQESSEPDLDPNIHSSKIMSRSLDQDTISTVSSLSSLSSGSVESYPTLQHRHSTPSLNKHLVQSPQSTNVVYQSSSNAYHHQTSIATPPVSNSIRTAVGGTIIRNRPLGRDIHMRSADAESIPGSRDRTAYLSSRSATLDRNFFNSNKNLYANREHSDIKYERSIEESLQLIRMHMDSLNEVNSLAGIPSSSRPPASSDMVLAPPPEFCDTSINQSRGGSTMNRVAKTVIHISGDDSEADLPVRIIKKPLTHGVNSADDEHRTFRNKQLCDWSTKDTTDWLESLFMPEYKESFSDRQIDGHKLMDLNNEALISLGIRKIGHRVKMEKSLKRYKPVERIDL